MIEYYNVRKRDLHMVCIDLKKHMIRYIKKQSGGQWQGRVFPKNTDREVDQC